MPAGNLSFLGAGLDAYQQAARYGIEAVATMAYARADDSTSRAFRALGENTREYARDNARKMQFSERQRAAAGDRQRR